MGWYGYRNVETRYVDFRKPPPKFRKFVLKTALQKTTIGNRRYLGPHILLNENLVTPTYRPLRLRGSDDGFR